MNGIHLGMGVLAFIIVTAVAGNYFYHPGATPAPPAASQQQQQQQQQPQQSQQQQTGSENCQQKGSELDQAIQASHDQPNSGLKAMELGMALRGVGPCADANGNLPP